MINAKTVKALFDRSREYQRPPTKTPKEWAPEWRLTWPVEVEGFLWTGIGAIRRGRMGAGNPPVQHPNMAYTCRWYLRQGQDIVKPSHALTFAKKFTHQIDPKLPGHEYEKLVCPTGDAFAGEAAENRCTYVDAVLRPLLEGYGLYTVGHLGAIYAHDGSQIVAIIMPVRL